MSKLLNDVLARAEGDSALAGHAIVGELKRVALEARVRELEERCVALEKENEELKAAAAAERRSEQVRESLLALLRRHQDAPAACEPLPALRPLRWWGAAADSAAEVAEPAPALLRACAGGGVDSRAAACAALLRACPAAEPEPVLLCRAPEAEAPTPPIAPQATESYDLTDEDLYS